jgi:hypothetical protein
MDPGTRDFVGRPRWSALFPEGSLASDIAWRIEPVLERSPPHPRPAAPQESNAALGRLLHDVAAAFDVDPSDLRSARRGGLSASVARGALVHAARAQGGFRLSDVASFMGYASPAAAAAVAERFDRASRLDPSLRLSVRNLRVQYHSRVRPR